MTVPDLPTDLNGSRLSLLSDFHLGRFGTSQRVIAQALDAAGRFNADITLLAGDYIDARHSTAYADLLHRLSEHRNLIAVLGNHDYARGTAHLSKTLSILGSIGSQVLRNEALRVGLRSSTIWVVGLDDPFTLRDDIETARSIVPDDGSPILLLAHAPVISKFGDLHRVALVLCGHTHGGQIRIFPSGNVPGKRLLRWLARERGPRQDPDVFRGVHTLGASALVISNGLGVSLLPLRFRTRPQLILISLNSPAATHHNSTPS